jgi:cell division protein FtsZ
MGGAVGNAVARMLADDIAGVEFLAAHTEALTRGLGLGANPAIGAQTAQESLEELRVGWRGADLVFVTAGMGDGAGGA